MGAVGPSVLADQPGGDPDYIVLSEIWYYRFVEDPETREAEALRELFRGELGYRAVANFYTTPLVPIRDLFMNPRILIFEKAPPEAGGGRQREPAMPQRATEGSPASAS